MHSVIIDSWKWAIFSGALGTNSVSASLNPEDLLDQESFAHLQDLWEVATSVQSNKEWCAGQRVWKVGQNAYLDAEKGIINNLKQAVTIPASVLVGS